MMDLAKYDLIVVGTGISGATIAYIAGHDFHQRVLVLEKNTYMGGMLYDEKDPYTGIIVQKFGTHFFHTNNENVYKFLSIQGNWYPFSLTARCCIQGKEVPMPLNITAVDKLFSAQKALKIKCELAEEYRYESYVPLFEMLKSENETVAGFAKFLMREYFLPYSARQNHVAPESLDGRVLRNNLFTFSTHDRCYEERFQMLPQGGFSSVINTMLDDPHITVMTGIDATKHLQLQEKMGTILYDGEELDIPVVYTGRLDLLFGSRYGKLKYDRMRFEHQRGKISQEDRVSFLPQDREYTSSTDFSKMEALYSGKETVYSYEYPVERTAPDTTENVSCYPRLDKESCRAQTTYKKLAKKFKNLYCCGRLAEHRFITIADCIQDAMDVISRMEFKSVDLTPDYIKTKRRPRNKLLNPGNNFARNQHIASDLLVGDLTREVPQITVIIPTYKRLDSLKRAVESVCRQDLAKDKYEILVLDNDPNPENETAQYLVENHPENLFYYKNRENLGAYGNMNRCFELARTKWVSMVHDDDLLYPNALRWALNSKEHLDDGKLGAVIPRQKQAFSEKEMIKLSKQRGILNENIVEERVKAVNDPSWRWRIFHQLTERTSRRYWRISKFDCYMVPFLYPAPSYGTLFNRDAVLEIGGFGEGYPTDDNLCYIRLSEKYRCYLCGEIWGLYAFYSTDVTKPRSSLQFVDATVQYRLYMEERNLLCRIVGKFIRKGAYVDSVHGDFNYGCFSRGYNAAYKNYQYFKDYEVSERQILFSRRIKKCWELWILLRAAWFGKRIDFALIEKSNGEHF